MKRKLAAFGVVLAVGTLVVASVSTGSPEGRKLGPPDFDHATLEPRELRGTMFAEHERFGLPGDLALVGRHVVLVDRMGAPAVHLIDRQTGELQASLGEEGEGPGEFRAPVALDALPGEEAFWLFDVMLQRMTRIELDHGRLRRPLPQSSMRRLRADGPVIQPVWTGPNRILGLGFFFGGRFAELDAGGMLLRHTGPLPPNPHGVPVNVLLHAYQGSVTAPPDRSRIVVATRHAGLLVIYAPNGTLYRRVSGPFSFEPRFQVAAISRRYAMASGDDLRFGYVDVAATQERIYALFSGRTRAGFPGRANYAGYVHVFDWEGRFLEALKLDADAFTIAVDEEEGALYAVRHLPAPAVLRYSLPSARPKR